MCNLHVVFIIKSLFFSAEKYIQAGWKEVLILDASNFFFFFGNEAFNRNLVSFEVSNLSAP